MTKHKKINNGTKFEGKGTAIAKVVNYDGEKNGNHYYWCEVEPEYTLTGTERKIQYSNLNNGNFGEYSKPCYEDEELYQKLRRVFDHIKERIRIRKSYRNVKLKFENFTHFYNYFAHRSNIIPGYRERILKNTIEKDLVSDILIDFGILDFKEYSEITIFFTDLRTNLGIKTLKNSKEKLEVLKKLDKIKYLEIVELVKQRKQKDFKSTKEKQAD